MQGFPSGCRGRCDCFLTRALFRLACVTSLLVGSVCAARESVRGYDADLTLFSPEGRLYQVEYVMRGVGHYGCPIVGVHGEGCCVVACKRDLPDELVYPESVSNIFRITDDIYSAATGLSGDVRYQVKRARLQALEYKRQYGCTISSRLLTLAMADAAQVNTQHAALRPMACVSLFVSVDDLTGPTLFRVEPSGQVFQAWGTAAGKGSASSMEFLEEAFKSKTKAGLGDAESLAKGDATKQGATQETSDSKHEKAGQGKSASRGGPKSGDVEIASPGRQASSSVSDGDQADSEDDKIAGFGVTGEEDTVQLALQALSKASSGKDAQPLTDSNVEIVVASAKTGMRICSRKEVKGFLGRMACSPNGLHKAVER